MDRHIPEITGMRAFAALQVLLLHVLLAYGYVTADWPKNGLGLNHGWIGVDFFFVLSGFLLAIPMWRSVETLRRTPYWKGYLIKRWFRIAPPYYAAMVLALLLAGNVAHLWREPTDIVLHLLYLHTFSLATFASINGVFWTLAIEFQFYLLLPLVVLLLAHRRWPIVAAALAAGTLGWRMAMYHGPVAESWMTFTLPAFLIHFTLGILAARLFVSKWRLPMPGAYVVAGATLGFIVAPLAIFNPAGSYNQGDSTFLANLLLRPMLALGFTGIIIGVCCGTSAFNRLLSVRPMQWAGEISYSLYLSHVPVLLLMMKLPFLVAHGFLVFSILAVAGTLASAAAFYALVERPSLVLRAWILSRRVRVPGGAPGPEAPSRPPVGMVAAQAPPVLQVAEPAHLGRAVPRWSTVGWASTADRFAGGITSTVPPGAPDGLAQGPEVPAEGPGLK